MTDATKRISELEAALRQSMIALDDWLNIWAADMCGVDRVEQARERVSRNGTIAYISDVQSINRAALRENPDLHDNPGAGK